MKDIIVKVTNFVNENTILLIGICAFLILVLIVYLIDNSIKTKKMQKALKEMDAVEDKVVEDKKELQNDAEINVEIKQDEDEPTFDSISLINDEDTKEESNIDEEVEEVKPINSENPIVEEPVETNVPKEEKLFTNKKSLSEILSKKKESINENDADKTLEETTEFNNTF